MTAVEWNFLPHNPQAFFGLPDGFDRKQLKRAYNGMIRQFKPEKFPDEFQKIRGAYELLDGQIRYGQTQKQIAQVHNYQWLTEQSSQTVPAVSATDGTSAAGTNQRRQPNPDQIPIHLLLEKNDPLRVYAHLNKRNNKTPYEYYALAVMSDIATDDSLMFFKWLLTGLKEHPGEVGLFSLLYEYLHREIPEQDMAAILLTTSKVIRTDRFYFLTEQLWSGVLRQSDFETFKTLLAKCEQNLKAPRVEGQIAFYTRIIKQALWKADDQWLDEAFTKITTGVSDIPTELEMDIEMLEMMREYFAQYETLIKGNSIRKRIHLCIKRFFTEDELVADREVIECQYSLAEDASSVLDAFPMESEEALPMFVLWNWISDEVAQRHGLVPKRQSSEKFHRRVFRLLQDLDETWNVKSSQIISYYVMRYLPYLLFAISPFILLSHWLDSFAIVMTCIIVACGLIVLFHAYLLPNTIEPLFNKMIESSIRKNYHRLWRGRFVQFLEATQVSIIELSMAIHTIVNSDHHRLRGATWLVYYVPKDMGLAFYSLAARFRH